MKKVAIVGSGMCALAVAFYLKDAFEVTLFDEGSGASSVCGGFIHPFKKLERVPAMQSAFEEARKLIGPFLKSPIVRLAKGEEDLKTCKHALYFDDISSKTAGYIRGPGLLIEEGGVVDTPAYLDDLFRRTGAERIEARIEHLDELSEYDVIVVAAGAGSKKLINISIEVIYGRALIVEWKGEPLPCGVLGPAYLAPMPGKCVVGATYERRLDPSGIEKLKKCATLMAPHLKDARVLSEVVGARARGPRRQPFAERINSKTWALGGVGSRGLLYHAELGKKIATDIKKAWKDGDC